MIYEDGVVQDFGESKRCVLLGNKISNVPEEMITTKTSPANIP